jgi:CRP/FNR family transcriptional regulator, cyclic AMP receptor protein
MSSFGIGLSFLAATRAEQSRSLCSAPFCDALWARASSPHVLTEGAMAVAPHTERGSDSLMGAAESHPVLRRFDRSSLAHAKRLRLRANRTVLRPKDSEQEVLFLLRGTLRVYQRVAGRECLMALLQAPSTLRVAEVLTGRSTTVHATTLEPSELLSVPASLFLEQLQAQPELGRDLSLELARGLNGCAERIQTLAFQSVPARLAGLLLEYATAFGEAHGEAIRITQPLSQERMAKDLASSRRAVNVALQLLKRGGVVQKRSARYWLPHPTHLRELAQRT